MRSLFPVSCLSCASSRPFDLRCCLAYEGEGRLVFANPSGVVTGWARAKLDATGRLAVEFDMAEVEADAEEMKKYSAEIQLEYLLTRQKPKKIEGGILRTFGGAGDSTPRYGDLVITTHDGVLTASPSKSKQMRRC